ncbi:MAG: hypothetical protein LBE82_05715 [Chitinophagaceae bacterium]|jgi:hypothetical protein|nr:hypothetical protein [Chitinophagaceae bacterium]
MENFEKNSKAADALTEADEMLLWNFIAGIATDEEQQQVEQLIHSNDLWKNEYEAFLQTHQMLMRVEADQPSMRFTKNVMEQVAQYRIAPSIKTYVNKNIFRSIGGLFVFLILGCMALVLKNIDWSGVSSDINTAPPIKTEIVSHIISGNVFAYLLLFLNVVLGFYLLDRYLVSKRKRRHYLMDND